MKLKDLKLILLASASSAMKEEGKVAFQKGLVTYFKGKKINNIYHVYSRVKDKYKPDELNIHIKINLEKKELAGVECSCSEFKEFTSSDYTFMCSHITATAYKFLNLMSRGKTASKGDEEKTSNIYAKPQKLGLIRLVRKAEKDSLSYEVIRGAAKEKLILKPNELRGFLERIESKKIKFKFDYIEFTVPIFHKDLPVTFNLREDGGDIVLTTQRQLPISLNPNNDAYYFKDELYLPSENQIKKYIPLYEKLKISGKLSYKKEVNTYLKLISLLSSITQNINISQGLKAFIAETEELEFFIFKEESKIYCEVFLNYGEKKISMLKESRGEESFIRDHKAEEKLLIQIERDNFIKEEDRLVFIGGDEKLFNILSGRGSGIGSLGKVTFGKGLNNTKIYNSSSIKADLRRENEYYDFSYDIGNISRAELKNAFEAYRVKERFYKTKGNDFLDFEDEGIKSFFNLLEVLQVSDAENDGELKLEENKALYLYENLKKNRVGYIKGAEKLEEVLNKLKGINNMKLAVPKSFKGTLREYQVKGFKWLKTLSELGFGGILADEMGLGKTIQTIVFIVSEQSKRTIIVCPTSLIYNWKEELQKFAPSLKVLIMHGAERINNFSNISEYDVMLTTYGTLRIDIEYYNDTFFDYCFIDEGQNIKNAAAKNTKVIKKIKAAKKFALTGTPIENNLMELWSIFDFIMPGYLYTKEEFEEKFILKGEDKVEELRLLIKPFILRRTKKEVARELPDKIEKKFLVEMTAPQKAVYSSYIKTVKEVMKSNVNGKIEVFSYLTKLRQICLDPSLIIEDYRGGSGKLEVAVELIKQHISSKGKVLLFSQFTSVLERIEKRLKREKIKFFHLDGGTKPKERIEMVKEFNSSDDSYVFLISLKAGGTGLNLTSANLVIHFDPWWNPAVEDQATDRAHRIGQKNIVEVIKLVAKGTIEEKIILLQEDKKELINNIITGELQNTSLLSSLSKEELLQLFDRE